MATPSPKRPLPVLRQFANLWTLTHQPSAENEWSLEEKFRQAKKAGFDGMGGLPTPGVAGLCQKYGLEYVCYLDASAKNYADRLHAAKETQPVRVDVQLCNHDTSPPQALAVWLKMEALAEKLGLELDLEIHRDTCTETPEKYEEIARLYRQKTGRPLRFCWDFSHPAVIKHLAPPYTERLLTRPKLVQLARQLHFRPFNGHHAQVPATNGRGKETAEFVDYLDFVDTLLACWLQGARGGEVLYVCPEFGPVSSGYGLSVFPNVWKEAIHLRQRTQELWEAQLSRFKR